MTKKNNQDHKKWLPDDEYMPFNDDDLFSMDEIDDDAYIAEVDDFEDELEDDIEIIDSDELLSLIDELEQLELSLDELEELDFDEFEAFLEELEHDDEDFDNDELFNEFLKELTDDHEEDDEYLLDDSIDLGYEVNEHLDNELPGEEPEEDDGRK